MIDAKQGISNKFPRQQNSTLVVLLFSFKNSGQIIDPLAREIRVYLFDERQRRKSQATVMP